MKKLLVILLLLFPFHGAGAEIIGLICKDENGNSTSMLITDVANEADLKKIKEHWSEYEIQYTNVAELEDSDS